MKNLAIGMFDSGIGGLTVLKEVRALLPSEHILYLGDTARVPYGNKSPHTVTKYALESALFLLTKGVKVLVIACNTSAALSLSILKKKLPVPVLGVIDPGAREAVAHTKNRKVGVIGTKATIRSMAYERAIKRLDPTVEVLSKSCPLFVPIVEEGLEHDEVARIMADRYLRDLRGSGIDVLVMGCTHYPILEDVVKDAMGDGVSIVHTGRETAKAVKETLEEGDLIHPAGKGTCEYFVTDSPDLFKEVGGRFLGEPLQNVSFLKNLDFKDFLLSE
ncbi:MAG: Glutamate racemase [Syntrophorhabdus sp. PtaU1.Bin050]|nr:MAG: Glutamate racemase [Syntrophorhabdus sp. PtaU1.Bin050]